MNIEEIYPELQIEVDIEGQPPVAVSVRSQNFFIAVHSVAKINVLGTLTTYCERIRQAERFEKQKVICQRMCEVLENILSLTVDEVNQENAKKLIDLRKKYSELKTQFIDA